MEIDMMAQFLGADDHCFTYEYEHVDESMEAIAALFLPTLETESNSSSSCHVLNLIAQFLLLRDS